MIRAAFPTLRRRAAQARHTQLRTLARLQAFDDAVAQHMAHGAMAGQDPLTDSLMQQLDCAAEEGARPPSTATSALTPQQWAQLADTHREWRWLPAAVAVVAVLSAVASAIWPWGVAA